MEENYIKLNIYRSFKIVIYKPLIAMKVALFLWYGAATTMLTFLSVFLRHRGITVQEISLMYMVIPVIQFLGTSVLGISADKIGKSKPFLIGNLIFTAATTVALVNVPIARDVNFQPQTFLFSCHKQNSNFRISAESECGVADGMIQLHLCEVVSPDNMTYSCFDQTSCGVLSMADTFYIFLNNSEPLVDLCSYDVHSAISSNGSLCDDSWTSSYLVSCKTRNNRKNSEESLSRDLLLMTYLGVCLLLLMSFVNVFRFFDITVMALVKEHNADYGKERIFSMLGHVICPVFTGYIVHSTTPFGQEKNYDAALYLYTVMALLTALVVMKVDVRGCEPGKKMCRKIAILLKNLDILFFFLVLHVLGMTWGFVVIFKNWYLEDLKAEPYQIGLIETTYSLYGIPFLFISQWILKKIGTENIFVLALIGRAIYCCGYSFLQIPWPAFVLEITSTVTYHLLWVAVMYYCKNISPPGLVATINAFAGSIHFTIGRVLGSLIGGMVMSKFGGRMAFRVLGVINAISALIYILFLCIRRRQKNKNSPDNISRIIEVSKE